MIPLINHDDWWKPLIETVDEKWGEIISFLPSMTIETTMKKTLNNHSYHHWITINIQYITINNTHSHLILTWFTSTKFQTNPSIVEGEFQTMIRAPVGHLEELDPSSEVGVSPQTFPTKINQHEKHDEHHEVSWQHEQKNEAFWIKKKSRNSSGSVNL